MSKFKRWLHGNRGSDAERVTTQGVFRGPNDDPNLTDEELIEQRRKWFESYVAQPSVRASSADEKYTCPCCGHRTLDERGGYEICSECGWEDDGQDDHNADMILGGPNGPISLADARAAFVRDGGVRAKHEPPNTAN